MQGGGMSEAEGGDPELLEMREQLNDAREKEVGGEGSGRGGGGEKVRCSGAKRIAEGSRELLYEAGGARAPNTFFYEGYPHPVLLGCPPCS